jgi:hypothetical protein
MRHRATRQSPHSVQRARDRPTQVYTQLATYYQILDPISYMMYLALIL